MLLPQTLASWPHGPAIKHSMTHNWVYHQRPILRTVGCKYQKSQRLSASQQSRRLTSFNGAPENEIGFLHKEDVVRDSPSAGVWAKWNNPATQWVLHNLFVCLASSQSASLSAIIRLLRIFDIHFDIDFEGKMRSFTGIRTQPNLAS